MDNLQTFPIAEWKGLSMLTEHQRDMMRQPFLGSYLFFWHQNERKALELLEQNRPLQRVCILLYRYGVRLFLSVERLKRSPVDENDRCGKIPPAVGCI